MEEKRDYWTNHVAIGHGTLIEFQEKYEYLSKKEGQFVTASQLFPTGKVEEGSTPEGKKYEIMTYEFVIYFKTAPSPTPVKKTESEVLI